MRLSQTRRVAAAVTAAGATAALTAGLLASTAAPAAADTQVASCVDDGGTRWFGKVVWGGTYTSGPNQRVTLDFAGWTTTRDGRVRTDSRVRTYDGTGARVSDLRWEGRYNYRDGRAYKVRNPRNPILGDRPARVRITVGVDGDGRGDCTMTFVGPRRPSGPSPSPTPTVSPTATSSPTPTVAPTATTSATPTPTATTSTPVSTSDRYEADVVTATNAERTSRNLVALAPQACVDKYAEAQAAAMARENRLYHQDLGPILRECQLRTVGENVAYGYRSGAAVTEAWMNSEGHRANILNGSYRLLGVGAVQNASGQWYVAQVFGTLA